jgi:hypothetical protein
MRIDWETSNVNEESKLLNITGNARFTNQNSHKDS